MIVTIDRIESKFAVCEMEDGSFENLPKAFLPPKAKEGSKLKIELDLKSEAEDRKRIKGKMDGLFKG
ncbi:MAG: DUF3006 domain-containing protein [Eubacteriales bacterium]|nr:DUF3006 domain-containing protein [Eubacteriales bacterium]MDD4323898.1 DUF3006 domain-containing protein [Eubacteriales bacterium]MDD4540550.1 DUF3006 domain-containing protein [Eubacteriales bacterium]